MKKITLFLAASAFVFSISSCNKCQDCSCDDEPAEEICQDDFDSKDEYKQAISLIEAFGCTCK